jgi:hypothetical protein
LLIFLSFSGFKYKDEVIAFVGAAIIGLHVLQWIDEQKFINSGNEQGQ